ncbi:MAG TPA: hypothetical protein VLH75_03160 [Longimicrobiales bacterium]|nr:hypothetical protein [Longimicrobiales bacterium]
MSIHKIGSDLVRPLPERGGAQGRKAQWEPAAQEGRPGRADHVGLSPEGLALARGAPEAAPALSEERLEVLRQRVAGGFYDDPPVAEEVAHRLLASGDLDLPR